MVRWHGSGVRRNARPCRRRRRRSCPSRAVERSVPRVAGGLGTMFFSAKVGVLDDDVRDPKVAVAPTLEILGGAVLDSIPGRERRARWGLPVSVHFDRETVRIFASSGYFSPGIWYAGPGSAGQSEIAPPYRAHSAWPGRCRGQAFQRPRRRAGAIFPAAHHSTSGPPSPCSGRSAGHLGQPLRTEREPHSASACH